MDPIALTVSILSEALPTVPVQTEVPEDRPDRMVVVSLDGGTGDGFILRPRIGLTCWGRTDMDANGIATACISALSDAALDHPYLSHVALETISREEWGRNGHSRYLVELDLTINTN